MVQQVSLVSMQFEYVTRSVLRELKEQWTHTSDYRSNLLKRKNLKFEDEHRQGLPEGDSYQYNYYNHCGSNRSLLARNVIGLREYSENVFKTLSMKWYELFPAKEVNASCLVLPLKGFHTSKVLQMFVDVAAVQRSTEMFQSNVVSAVIDLHWDMYCKKAHMYSLVLYLMLLTLFVLLTAYFQDMVQSTDHSIVTTAWMLQCIKCAIVLYLVSQEIVEAVAVKASKWLLDFWNVLDITAYTLTLIAVLKQATAADTTHPALNTTANIINATAAVLLWFKLLHFMRPYQSTGPLVMMIFEIIADIRTFLLILAIVVMGFANAFYVILSKGPTSSYGTPFLAVRSSFSYMLGGYDLEELDDSRTPVVLSIFWAVFMVIVAIVLLNVLIAIISSSYERLTALSTPNWRLEKAKIVLSCHTLLSKQHKQRLDAHLKRYPYLQVIKPTASLQSEGNDEWTGKVGAIVKQVRAAVNSDSDGVRNNVSKMKDDITKFKDDISKLDANITAVQTYVGNLDSSITAVRADVTGVKADVSKLDEKVDSVTNKVAVLQGSVDTSNALPRELIAEMCSTNINRLHGRQQLGPLER
jgi:Ion transport protein